MKDLIRRRRLSYDLAVETEPESPPADPRPPRTRSPQSGGSAHRVNPTLSAAALAEAQNALAAAHASGDYRHQSVADLLRAALQSYDSGLRLTRQARSGPTKRHTVELPAQLLESYRELPSRSRGVIIERALLSLLARGLDR